MNRFLYLIVFTAFILMSQASFSYAGITDELNYVNDKTDFYMYADFSQIIKFLGSRGINLADLDSLADDETAGTNDRVLKNFGLKPGDINEILLAVHLRDTQKKSGYLIFISTKKGRGHVPESFKKNPVKLKSGTAYKASADEDIVFARINDFFVIGSSAYLESFLDKRAQKKISLSERSALFKNKSAGKSVYFHLTVTDYLTAEMNKAMSSKEGRGLRENVFIRTLLTLESSDWGIVLGDKIVFTSGVQGSKPEDSERLLMIAHTWVVGSSLIVSFADMFLAKAGDASKGEITDNQELMTWLQKAFGRIHVRQVDKGVVSTFEMVPQETDVVIAFIKKEMEKEKKARLDRVEREKIARLTGAIKHDNLENIKKYIKEKYKLNGFDTDGNTPLGMAAYTGNVKIARLLLENGAGINVANVDKLLPLHVAVKNDRKEMIVFLLGKGADVNAKAENDLSPLHYNALQGDSEITRILIAKGAAVNALDTDASTPLHYASSQGFIKVVKVLTEKKADPLMKNKNNQRAVDVAAQNNQSEIVGFFKTAFGLEPESIAPDDDNYNEEFNLNDDPGDEFTDDEE